MRRPQTLLPFGVMVLCALAGLWLQGFAFNFTPSMPLGIYCRVYVPVEPGVLVSVCPPESVARTALRQGILKAGSCPGEVMPLLKRIAATEGAVVEVTPAGVLVEGRWLQPPAPALNRQGLPLATWPRGRYALAPGQLWLTASHPRSWDSRYFGPVAVDAVRGTYLPLWTWSP